MMSKEDSKPRKEAEVKRGALSYFLKEQVKSALVRARYITIQDMDASSSFFFSLDRKPRANTQMLYLRDTRGHTRTHPREMRNMATDFYKDLYKAMACDWTSVEE